jgi:hypothetical protein
VTAPQPPGGFMPTWNLSLDHDFPQERAVECVKFWLGRLEKEYGSYVSRVKSAWDGDKVDFQCAIFGFDISVRAETNSKAVDVEVDVPWLAIPFKGKVVSFLRNSFDRAKKDFAKSQAS